jgi:hypothetical protein
MFIEQGAMQLNHIKHICIIFKYIHLMYGPKHKLSYIHIFQTYSTPKLSPSHFLTICEKTKRLIHLFRFVQNYKLLLFTFLVPRLGMTLK